jgi:capsular polysaccharide biosynthesis protein
MDVHQININNKEDEIDLRELIICLWRKKVIIILITLIVAILTGIFSVFVLTPVYHAKLNIIINMPETYHTEYGDYTLPITTNQQYINLITSNNVLLNTIKDMHYSNEITIEELREKITIGTVNTTLDVEQNSYDIKVAADNPTEARQLAQVLFDNYIEFLDVLTAEGSINYYSNNCKVNLKSLEGSLDTTQKLLLKDEELLAETAQTINQKEEMKEIQDQINTSDFVVLENIVNENYTVIENDIIEKKQTINNIENSIQVYNTYLEKLDIIRNYITKYNQTGEFDELEGNIVRITKTNVFLPSQPVAPSQKTSPSNAKNVVVSIILGGMIGTVLTLIKEYWIQKP